MPHSVLMQEAMRQFACLGDACADTCCQQWSMQVDDVTQAKYASHADLGASIEPGAHGEGWVMKRRADTGHCVRLESGWCGIQKIYGAEMLGDACALYPRVTRALGDVHVMTSTLSCPEIARLMIAQDHAEAYSLQQAERVPHTIHDYVPEGISGGDAMAIHRACLEIALSPEVPPEIALVRLIVAAKRFEKEPAISWRVVLDEVCAATTLPSPQRVPEDAFNVLHALCGLVMASGKKPSTRLLATTRAMEKALQARLDWGAVTIRTMDNSWDSWQHVREAWYERHAAAAAVPLRRFLAAQLAFTLFPFAGLGTNLGDRAVMLAVRFATIKLAWMCHAYVEGALGEEVQIRSVQAIARALDHLSDATYPMQVYASAGWLKEERMSAIIQL